MNQTKKITFSALFLALGLVLPFLTGQIPSIGSQLLPMHIPVLLCGYVCGGPMGLLIGFLTPLLRSVMFSMPPMLNATCMAFELATYGFVAGLLYDKLPKKTMNIWISLIGAMLAGRIVWGVVSFVILGMAGQTFAMSMFIAGAFMNAIPGIILQLVFIPVLVLVLKKAKFMH